MAGLKIISEKRKTDYRYSLTFIFLVFVIPLILIKDSFAWKPVTHIFLEEEVIKDAQDGEVEIKLVDYQNAKEIKTLGIYKIDENIKMLINTKKSVFFAGNFGPDAYPDVITGGMVIHADYSKIGGPATSDWLRHLWENGYKNQKDPDIQAWVLGFLCHAAGDMYIHTFLNHFAGGPFILKDGDNAARHILFEGYIAKRQEGAQIYTIDLPPNVRDFIYEYLVKADKNTFLRNKLLIYDAGADLSPPLLFSLFKDWLQENLIDKMAYSDVKIPLTNVSVNPVTEYAKFWIEDIDTGLRAWVDFSHDFAGTFFFKHKIYEMPYQKTTIKGKVIDEAEIRKMIKEQLDKFLKEQDVKAKLTEKSEEYGIDEKLKELQKKLGFSDKAKEPDDKTKKDRVSQLVLNYTYDHLLSMLGAPDFVGKYGIRYTAAVMGSVFDKAKDHLPDHIRDFFRSLEYGLMNYICQKRFGFSYELIKDFDDNPQTYFDIVLNAPPLIPGLNTDSKKVSMAEANKILKINDPGYTDPNRKWFIVNFPPAYNTIVLIKLMMLKESELYRLFDDLEKITTDKKKSDLRMKDPNVMIDGDFCHSIDDNNSWKFGSKMIVARNPSYYSLLFMKQIGEDDIKNPFKYEEPTPEGAVIGFIDLLPRYLQEFKDWGRFKAKAFINWFYKSSAEYVKAGQEVVKRYLVYKFSDTEDYWHRSNEIVKEVKGLIDYYHEMVKGYLEKGEVPAVIERFYEELTLTDLERKMIKAGEDLTFKIKYYVWGYKDKEVKVKVVAETNDGGIVAIPFEKKHKFTDAKDEFQEGEAEFSFACQYPTEKYDKKDGQQGAPDPKGRPMKLKLFVDDNLRSEVDLDNVYKVQGPGTDFNGYGNLRVKVKYDFKVPKEWESTKSNYKPTFKVTLVPLTEMKKEMKEKLPKPLIERSDVFNFESIPMGQYKVVVEVMKEEPSEEGSVPETTPPADKDTGATFMPSVKRLFLPVTVAYAATSDPPKYSGPRKGEAYVTLFNSGPVDPVSIEKVEPRYLPSFTVEVELGNIDAEDLFAKKKKKQASLWKILVTVQDEDGRPVIKANVSTGGINAEKNDLGEGKFLIGPFESKIQRVNLFAQVYESSVHTQKQISRYGEVEAVYNGNSQVNETIVVKGLKQPKWQIFGRAKYQDGSPLIIKTADTFNIVMREDNSVTRKIEITEYSFGPFPVPPDSGFDDPRQDSNSRSFEATVMRKEQIIARASGYVRRQGEEGTEFNIQFPNNYKKIIEGEEKEEDAKEEKKEEKKPRFVNNTKQDENKKDGKDDKKKVPSFVKNTDKGKEPAKETKKEKPAALAPEHVCINPQNLRPPSTLAEVPRILDGMGFEILNSQTDGLTYVLQVRDAACAAQYGIKEKKVWRAGPPPKGARYELDAKIRFDQGAFSWIINCFVENMGGKIKVNLTALSVEVTNWSLIPSFIGIVARGENNQWYDLKSSQQAAPSLSPSVNKPSQSRPTLFDRTFDAELENRDPSSDKTEPAKTDNDEFWGDLPVVDNQ